MVFEITSLLLHWYKLCTLAFYVASHNLYHMNLVVRSVYQQVTDWATGIWLEDISSCSSFVV